MCIPGARTWTHAGRTDCGTRLFVCTPNTSGATSRRSGVRRYRLRTGKSATATWRGGWLTGLSWWLAGLFRGAPGQPGAGFRCATCHFGRRGRGRPGGLRDIAGFTGRREPSITATPRVGLFGYLGSGNIGNDASMEAVLRYLSADHPDAILDAMCMGPERLKSRTA